jgi:alkylhydroperoxidase family enzyme
LFAEVKEKFSPRQIVELILTVGYYMMVARLLETTGVEIESANDRAP